MRKTCDLHPNAGYRALRHGIGGGLRQFRKLTPSPGKGLPRNPRAFLHRNIAAMPQSLSFRRPPQPSHPLIKQRSKFFIPPLHTIKCFHPSTLSQFIEMV